MPEPVTIYLGTQALTVDWSMNATAVLLIAVALAPWLLGALGAYLELFAKAGVEPSVESQPVATEMRPAAAHSEPAEPPRRAAA